MSKRIQIRGGRLIDPSRLVDDVLDLFIDNGVIVGVGGPPEGFEPCLEIDASGQIVCPGLVDLSVRLREPGLEYKATIASESMAAAAGGITTVCVPPDTQPVIDTPAVVRLIQQKAALTERLRVVPIGALTRGLNGHDLSEMSALRQVGCCAVSNASAPMANPLVLRRAMEYAASHDLLVIIRPEDEHLAEQGCVHEGSVSARMGLRGIPYAAETVAVAQVLALIEHTGARVHFAQLSCARAMRSIARAREKGLPVSADVAVHQLHLTDEAVAGFDSSYHLRPPLRSLSDLEGLREGIRSGFISAICSDHQPHEPDAKLDAFPATEPGMASLQTLLPLTLRLVEEGLLTHMEAIAALTDTPASLLGLEAGTLSPGASADVCVFDPARCWTVNEATWLSAGQNTPYWWHELKGQVTHTLLGGKIVHAINGLEVL